MKKVVLRFRENEFKNDVAAYGRRTKLEKEIKAELRKLLPSMKIDNKYLEGGIELNFYNAIEKAYPKYKDLGIKATKIPDLIDLDTTKLFKLVFEYENGDGLTNRPAPCTIKSPSQNQYEDLAETQEEIDKIEAVEKVIQSIYEAEKVLGIEVYKGSIAQAFKGWISATLGSQKLWFNSQQVLNQRRYKKKEELVV